jgi:hypothetical protein
MVREYLFGDKEKPAVMVLVVDPEFTLHYMRAGRIREYENDLNQMILLPAPFHTFMHSVQITAIDPFVRMVLLCAYEHDFLGIYMDKNKEGYLQCRKFMLGAVADALGTGTGKSTEEDKQCEEEEKIVYQANSVLHRFLQLSSQAK